MLAFHNDIKIKNKYLKRIRAHAEADEIIKGVYWEEGKGCAVGCTIHSGNHAAYETELGIPQWMAKLEDRLFEGMPNKRSKTWPVEFLESIKPGVDLQKCLIPMLIFIVESARENTKNKKSLAAIDGVLLELRKNVLDIPSLLKARTAAADATAAAYAAAYAADAAAYAADADDDAADAASYVAAYAANARSKEYEKFADKLLELIRECR